MATGNCTTAPSVAAASVSYNDTEATATYSCSSGYSLNGYNILNCVGTSWVGTLPTCEYLVVPNTYDFDHVINIFQEDTPTWLVYLFSAVAAIGALLLFTCLLICCMHLFGCYSGPLMGVGGTHVYAETHCAPCRSCYFCRPSEPVDEMEMNHNSTMTTLLVEEPDTKSKPVDIKVKPTSTVEVKQNGFVQSRIEVPPDEDGWIPPSPIEYRERGFARTVSEVMAKQPKLWRHHVKH